MLDHYRDFFKWLIKYQEHTNTFCLRLPTMECIWHFTGHLRTDIPMLENNWYRNVMIPVIYQDHTNVKSLIVPTLGYIWHFIGSAKLWYTNVGELLAWEWNDSSEIPRTYQCKILKCTSLGIYLVFYWKCYEVMYQCWGIIGIGMKWFQ